MRLVLDTHVLIWWHDLPDKVPPHIRQALKNPDHEVYLSAVNGWEMQIKSQLGKLALSKPWHEIIRNEQTSNQFGFLPIDFPHTEQLDALPTIHRDPFDRILIAQALHENLTIVTNDAIFAKYPIPLFW